MIGYSIVPPSYARGIPRLKYLGLIYLLFPIILFLLWILRLISLASCLVFVSIFAVIIAYILYLALRYNKIALSCVFFADDHLKICDQHKNVWRTIPYSSITGIQVAEIEGFMHGYHGVSGIEKYIIVMLNDLTSIPVSNFHDRFTHPDYFPIYYSDAVMHSLRTNVGLYNVDWMADN